MAKFILELDESPQFLYIANQRAEKIFIDGNEIKNWTSLKLNSSMDDITTHEIKFATVYPDTSKTETFEEAHINLSKAINKSFEKASYGLSKAINKAFGG